jgi:hypothetical protein
MEGLHCEIVCRELGIQSACSECSEPHHLMPIQYLRPSRAGAVRLRRPGKRVKPTHILSRFTSLLVFANQANYVLRVSDVPSFLSRRLSSSFYFFHFCPKNKFFLGLQELSGIMSSTASGVRTLNIRVGQLLPSSLRTGL